MRQLYIGRGIKGINTFFRLGQLYNLTPEADYRLKVLGYYFSTGNKNASATGRYFGIHRNTISAWLKQFNPKNPRSLEAKKPIHIKYYRKKIPDKIIQAIISLKRKYPYYGKEKISFILKRDSDINVSASTCGRVFLKYKLTYLWRTYESSVNFKKTIRKRKSKNRPPKQRKVVRPGQWIQIDTIVIYHKGQRVYVITAVDIFSRLMVAYAYKRPSSKNSADFLKKLSLFFPGFSRIDMIQSDNGSEFLKFFDIECDRLKIDHTFSYARSPKMNCYVERLNETIQLECLKRTDALSSLFQLNQKIIAYTLEYNAFRPHHSLDYKTPLQVYCNHFSNSSNSFSNLHNMMWTHTVFH